MVFLVLFFVVAVMTLEEMDEIREKKSGSIFHREFSVLGRRIASAGSAWFKTQLVIMAVTAMICTLGLTLLGNPYSVLLGLGIGLLDALPVFGTGAVLIPWGAFLLLEHQWWKGAVLLFIYGLCYFIRQFLEAKLMGSRMGLSALETLFSMYVGLELLGVSGFFLGPVGLLIIEDLVKLYGEDGESR